MEATSSNPMKKFTLKHEIHCSETHFWKVFFDKEFNTSLFLKELKFPEYEVLEQVENESGVKRRVRGRPKMDMPGPVAKVLGDSFGYEEAGTWDSKTKIWSWQMFPNRLGDKLRNVGKVRLEVLGDNKVRRIAEIEMEAKIFGVGGLIESSSEKQMTDGWNRSATYMNKWIADHPPT
jgi:hypothetical protein